MALTVLDGNQTATTLSSVITGGEHIVAHSVVCLGSDAISNITSAVSGSVVSVSNFPASQSTTFGAVTGSVSILNFPSTQTVTFAQAQVTFGSVTASVSVLNFPAIQSVTFGQTAVTGQVELGPTSLNALESITVTVGQVTVTGGLTNSELRASAVTIGGVVSISGTPSVTFSQASVTFGAVTGSVSVLNFPATQIVAGTVTANVASILDPDNTFQAAVENGIGGSKVGYSIAQVGDTAPNNAIQLGFDDGDGNFIVPTTTSGFPISGTVTVGSLPDGVSFGQQLADGFDGYGGVPVQIVQSSVTLPVFGTVTATIIDPDASLDAIIAGGINNFASLEVPLPISGTVTANTAYATSVTGNAGLTPAVVTAMPVALVDRGVYGGQIMSYDGSNTSLNVNVKGSLPTISGTVTASSIQGTSVTTSNFTSTTASTTLASANASRRGLTVFNEGAGNLHICAGATATTIAYQVRLSAGDYWECPPIQTSLTHSAQFASSGTARVVEIL